MKKFIVITILCASAFCLASPVLASAQNEVSIPDSFTVSLNTSNATDYAVYGNSFAFAEGNALYVYTYAENNGVSYLNGTLSVFSHTSKISAIEYLDGKLYFQDSATGVFLYENASATQTDFTFTKYDSRYMLGDYTYILDGDKLYILDLTQPTQAASLQSGEYRNIKNIEDGVYILNENGLCAVSDGSVQPLVLKYEDYGSINNIATADAADKLRTVDAINLVTVKGGAYLIETDIDSAQTALFNTKSVSLANDGMSAHLLFSSGNAAMISVNGKTYLTLSSNLTITEYTPTEIILTGARAITEVGIYSTPFVSEATKIDTLEENGEVRIDGLVSGNAFVADFYKVTVDGVTGYTLCSLLTPFTFEDGTQVTPNNPSPDYANNVQTAILVLVIVGLAIIAIVYVVFVGTKAIENNAKRSK